MRFLLIALLALIPATAPAQTGPEKMPPIQSERFARDLHDKKIEDIISLYTPDAEFIDPDGKTYKGLEQIRLMYEHITLTYDSDLHLKAVSFQQTHAFGIEHGTYTETLHNRRTGVTQHIAGTYVFLHERQLNGDWLIARQKWTQKPIK
jgi:ketosteroid isomerase-like protein